MSGKQKTFFMSVLAAGVMLHGIPCFAEDNQELETLQKSFLAKKEAALKSLKTQYVSELKQLHARLVAQKKTAEAGVVKAEIDRQMGTTTEEPKATAVTESKANAPVSGVESFEGAKDADVPGEYVWFTDGERRPEYTVLHPDHHVTSGSMEKKADWTWSLTAKGLKLSYQGKSRFFNKIPKKGTFESDDDGHVTKLVKAKDFKAAE